MLAKGEPESVEWRIVGASVRGAQHLKSGLPNQDAIGWWPESGEGPPVILAVADGHSQTKSFRSQDGSRLAVKSAIGLLRELISDDGIAVDHSALKRSVEEQLPEAIERGWRAAVAGHLAENPFTEEELSRQITVFGEAVRESLAADPAHAYGTTLMAALIHQSFIVCLQVGDGDILVQPDIGAAASPVDCDPALFGNVTTSLCNREAWKYIRVRFQLLSGAPPAMILLCTDGYSNAFADGVLPGVVGEILEELCTQGLEPVESGLPSWLEHASQKGTGDDVTVGIICRRQLIGSKLMPKPAAISAAVDGSRPSYADDQLDERPETITSEEPAIDAKTESGVSDVSGLLPPNSSDENTSP